MPLESPSGLFPNQGTLENLRAFIVGPLSGAYCRLYSNNAPFEPTFTPADLVEASFPGYVPQTGLMWSTPAIDFNGKAESHATALFMYPGGTGRYTVYGAYMTDVGLGTLYVVFPLLKSFTFGPDETFFPVSLLLAAVSEMSS